jgi:hypothetical protein
MKSRKILVLTLLFIALACSLIIPAAVAAMQYQLTISSTEGGSVTSPGEVTFTYDEGTVVYLSIETEEGYSFVNWTGDTSALQCQCKSTSITMNGNYAIIAIFEKGSNSTNCFIATAAYGTPMAEEVQVLREFRDKYLLTNQLGQALVDFYYRVSPTIAEFITKHPSLKPIVRVGLMPVVAMSTVVVHTNTTEKIAKVGLLVLIAVSIVVWAMERRGRSLKYS